MTYLERTGILKGMTCMQNKAYLLNENHDFFLTGYRVLQSQEKNCFVKCAKLLFNGKIKLLYFSSDYTPLREMLPKLSPENFINLVVNILSAVLDVQGNGFLHCPNIVIEPENIYVDPSTLEVRLIYIPVNMGCNHQSVMEFQNDLRSMLIRLIHTTPHLSSNSTVAAVNAELFNATYSLSDLHRAVMSKGKVSAMPPKTAPADPHKGGTGRKSKESGGGFASPAIDESAGGMSGFLSGSLSGRLGRKPAAQPHMMIKTIAIPHPHQYVITKPLFRIGRDKTLDGVVTFSKAVSRLHCEICYEGGSYYIQDKNSTHGTFVRHASDGQYARVIGKEKLQSGDLLKLADVEFVVSF